MAVITPAELLLAIAEHEELEKTRAALPGLTLEQAQRLLRGISLALQRPAAEAASSLASNPPAASARTAPAKAPSRSANKRASAELEKEADRLLAGAVSGAGGSATTAPRRVRVFSDGASRGNPGPAGAGAVILDPGGRVLQRLGRFLGNKTNNVAEYEGLLLGLRGAAELGAREVDVRADSELLIRQLQGRYQVKNAGIKPLYAAAKGLLQRFERVSLEHVPREENALADEMSNRAIDERM